LSPVADSSEADARRLIIVSPPLQLRCPACKTDSQPVAPSPIFGPEGRDDKAQCGSCSAVYAISNGIPELYVDDHTWRSKQSESDGWEAYNAELGQMHYEGIGAPPVDFEIPYIEDAHWASIGRNFDRVIEGLDFSGALVLDVGAGRPWAAKNFALRGARSIAMDVNAHPVVGLGRGWAMMQEAGVEFDMFVGDSENLPLSSNQFDYVFISAAMHHTNFLRRLASEMARVLKPGGMALIANEPTRAAFEDEGELLLEVAEPELRHGITERRPTTVDYLKALASAGLKPVDVSLGADCERPEAIWERIVIPALIPPRQEMLRRDAPGRFARAVRTRFVNVTAEVELRSVLPRGTPGLRKSQAQMMSALYARPDINIRATKIR